MVGVMKAGPAPDNKRELTDEATQGPAHAVAEEGLGEASTD